MQLAQRCGVDEAFRERCGDRAEQGARFGLVAAREAQFREMHLHVDQRIADAVGGAAQHRRGLAQLRFGFVVAALVAQDQAALARDRGQARMTGRHARAEDLVGAGRKARGLIETAVAAHPLRQVQLAPSALGVVVERGLDVGLDQRQRLLQLPRQQQAAAVVLPEHRKLRRGRLVGARQAVFVGFAKQRDRRGEVLGLFGKAREVVGRDRIARRVLLAARAQVFEVFTEQRQRFEQATL